MSDAGAQTIREGGCRCGQVRFAVSGAPMITAACHCSGCQKMTAGAYSLGAVYSADRLTLLSGEPAIGGIRGADRHLHCPRCMSWLWSEPAVMPGVVAIRTPMLDEARDLPPFIESFTSEKLPFAKTGAPHGFERFPDEAVFPALLEAYSVWEGRPVD